MDSNRPRGLLRRIGGMVQDALGSASGDTGTQVSGLAGVCVGFLLGILVARR